MPANRYSLGGSTPPGDERGTSLGAAPFLYDSYYFEPVSGSDHYGITANPTSGPLLLPNGVIDTHLEVKGSTTPGALPILSIDGSDHLQISQ